MTGLSQPDATPYEGQPGYGIDELMKLDDHFRNEVAGFCVDRLFDRPLLTERYGIAGDVVTLVTPLLAEAERRGAEKGWEACAAWFAYHPQHDYGPEHRVKGVVVSAADEANPYRKGA